MNRVVALLAWSALAGTLAVSPAALAQQNMGNMGNTGTMGGMGGMGGMGARLYNTETVETIRGEVVAVQKVAYHGRRSYGIHLLLKTASGNVSVHLGPSWFIERQAMKISAHERIEVTGSRVTYEGHPAIIAAQVRKGKQTMMLRDSRGFPLWNRSRWQR